MRKKRKKRKNHSFSKQDLIKISVSFFKKNPTKSFNYKQLSKKFKIKDVQTKTLLSECLSSLLDDGVLKEGHGKGSYRIVLNSLIETAVVESSNNSGLFLSSKNINNEIFVSHDNSLFSLVGDIVDVCIYKKKNGVCFGEIIKVNKRKKSFFVGVLEKQSAYGFVVPEGNVSFDVFIPKSSFNFNDVGNKVLIKIIDWDSSQKNPVGKVVENLGKPENHDVEMSSILYQHDLSPSFNKKIIEESLNISDKISQNELKNRVDFRGVSTFTIDPEDAKDFDDALSVQKNNYNNWEIGVHIADVSHYVKEDSLLDKESFIRSCSVYLVDRVIPMLPEKLSNDICSLKQGEDKLCYSVLFEFDNNFNLISHEISETRLK